MWPPLIQNHQMLLEKLLIATRCSQERSQNAKNGRTAARSGLGTAAIIIIINKPNTIRWTFKYLFILPNLSWAGPLVNGHDDEAWRIAYKMYILHIQYMYAQVWRATYVILRCAAVVHRAWWSEAKTERIICVLWSGRARLCTITLFRIHVVLLKYFWTMFSLNMNF